MPIVILIIATILSAAWLLLLGRACFDDWKQTAYNKIYDNLSLMEKLQRKNKETQKKLEMYDGFASLGIRLVIRIRLFINGNTPKKIQKLEKKNRALRNSEICKMNLFPIPGYVLLRELESISNAGFYTEILKMNTELYGKKHSIQKSGYLLAKLISYAILSLAASLYIGAIAMRLSDILLGAAIMGLSVLLVLVLVYSMYDDLSDRVKKRRASISKEFPNVVSKLALLVTSGMIMDKAWKLTANSNSQEIYREMKLTSEEMDNLVTPESALNNFINRCNTKETAKLAGVIMQNMSKGNARIGRLLSDMAHEAWQERQHRAKRDAQKANSRLMIPTMMLFITILIMLMVPIVMSFSGL